MSASSAVAISAADLANGPDVSNISMTGMTPSEETNPRPDFRVKTFARVAGMMSEPQVSVPIAIGAKPAATAAALPDDEPPGPCWKSEHVRSSVWKYHYTL